MTIAELLEFKVGQGVKCYLHIWDEALSVNIAGVDLLSGIMGTCDEETNVNNTISLIITQILIMI